MADVKINIMVKNASIKYYDDVDAQRLSIGQLLYMHGILYWLSEYCQALDNHAICRHLLAMSAVIYHQSAETTGNNFRRFSNRNFLDDINEERFCRNQIYHFVRRRVNLTD